MQSLRSTLGTLLGVLLAFSAPAAQESAVPEPPAPDPGEVEAAPVAETTPGADLAKANRLVREGDYVRAELVLAEQAKQFPDDPRLLLLHGEVLLALAQPARALPALERAVELDGEQPRVHFQLATALQATGDRERALDAFAREIELNEETQVRVMARLNRMMLFERDGDLEEAARELEAVLELDPTRVQAFGDLASLYLQAGRLDDAADCLEQGLAKGFRSARHHYILGARYYERKEFDAAVRALQKAIEIDPDLPGAERSLAGALDQAGREEEALEHFRRYLELEPAAPDAQRVSARIEEIQGG